MFGIVGSSLKMVKFEPTAPDISVACLNRVARRAQHAAPNNVVICCVEMLPSFGQDLQILDQQCCDMLRRNVAIVRPGLANTGPTML